MFVGPDSHILKLPNLFEPFHTLYDGYDLSDQGGRQASSRTGTPEKHGFLPHCWRPERARERAQ
jgi:hypothetical protein